MDELLSLFPAPAEGVASRVVDGLAVAVTPEDSTLHTFENEVATEIWRLADGRRPVSEIVDGITAAFEVDRARAEEDVLRFVRLLRERGLVEFSPEARPSR